MGLIESAKKLFGALWEALKKFGHWIKTKVVRFVKHIRDFFRNEERLKKLQENTNLLAISIKQNLENGDCGIVNCLYDQKTETVVDRELHAQDIEFEELDSEAMRNFGDKSMLILQ